MIKNRFKVLTDSIRKLILRRNKKILTKLLKKVHPEDIAYVFLNLRKSEKLFLFSTIPDASIKTKVLKELPPEETSKFIEEIGVSNIIEYLKDIPLDDLTDILSKIDKKSREEILKKIEEEKADKIKGLMSYPEDTAGGIMNPDVLYVDENSTMGEVEDFVRIIKADESNFYIYVVDSKKRLKGVLSFRDIVTNHPQTPVKDVMNENVIYVYVDDDQEDVARVFKRYNLLSAPVVDKDMKLLGIITVDDIIDVMQQEATEDIMKMAGVGEKLLVDAPPTKNFIQRFPWLFTAWLGGIFAGFLINIFNDFLQSQIALASFMPLILGLGGNIGNQCATIVVRGIALGKIDSSKIIKLFFNQTVTGLLLGLSYGVILGVVAHFQYQHVANISIVVAISLIVQLSIASFWGTFVPIILSRLKVDPAIATSPFIGPTMDMIGIVVYFSIAKMLM